MPGKNRDPVPTAAEPIRNPFVAQLGLLCCPFEFG